MEDLIREHASFLDASVDRNLPLNRKLKLRLRDSHHRRPVQPRRMIGRAVVCVLLLILFVFFHSAWIGRVTRISAVRTADDPYTELFQSTSGLGLLYSGGR